MIHKHHKGNNESRTILIISAITEFTLKNNKQEVFADLVVNHYHKMVEPEFRTMKFYDVETDADMKRNWQLLFRMVNADPKKRKAKLIVDLEVPIVRALQDLAPDIAQHLQIQLAAQHGSYFAPIMTEAKSDEIVNIANMMHRTGDMLKDLAPILEDGVIDEKDLDNIPAAIESIYSLIGHLVSERHALSSVMPEPDKPDNVISLSDNKPA